MPFVPKDNGPSDPTAPSDESSLGARESYGSKGTFRTTNWVAVLAAAEDDSPVAHPALEELCVTYWFPLYAYARRRGFSTHDAQDLTQDFFARVIEKRLLRSADPVRGRFRSFLLTAFNHFISDRHDFNVAEKRGGGRRPISIDERDAEDRYLAEPVDRLTPERVYERSWATTVLERAVNLLAAEFATSGRVAFFDELKPFLWGEKAATPYHEIATRFGMNEGAIRVSVSRLRKRYRELLRREIAHTVASAEELDDEIHHLMSVWGA